MALRGCPARRRERRFGCWAAGSGTNRAQARGGRSVHTVWLFRAGRAHLPGLRGNRPGDAGRTRGSSPRGQGWGAERPACRGPEGEPGGSAACRRAGSLLDTQRRQPAGPGASAGSGLGNTHSPGPTVVPQAVARVACTPGVAAAGGRHLLCASASQHTGADVPSPKWGPPEKRDRQEAGGGTDGQRCRQT